MLVEIHARAIDFHLSFDVITIRLFDADPGIDESWEEIVEVSFQAPKGEITLMEWAADQGVGMAVPAGSYRARYQGRAMQTAMNWTPMSMTPPLIATGSTCGPPR